MIPVEFDSLGSMIRGTFFPAEGDHTLATVIFLQGFPGTEGDELICERLARENVSVLTFNHRGILRSGGYFSFLHAIEDIGAALRFVQKSTSVSDYRINPDKIVLGGWSFGGALVPVGAVRYPEFRRAFAISGRNFGKEARKIESDPEYARQVTRNLEAIRAPLGPVKYRDDLIPELIKNQDSFDLEQLAPALKNQKILLIAGWDDSVVPIEVHTIPFYRALVENGVQVSLTAFQDEHEFSESKDPLVQVIIQWLGEE